MRATRAYIASAGTAAVMLGGAICMFALLSAFIAFGAWPGSQSNTAVDQVVLQAVQRHESPKVTVRRDAVAIARREARRQRALALANGTAPAVAHIPGLVGTGQTQPTGSAPASSGSGSGKKGGAGQPGDDVTTQVDNVKKQVQDTTQQVNQNVQNTATDVQDQVNDIVGGTTNPPPGSPVQQAKDGAGSILGH